MHNTNTHKVGIDAIGFYSSLYYLDLKTLAAKRGLDFNKFYVGLGQHKMAVPPPDEDIITMGANAAARALSKTDVNDIDMLLFATESGLDHSKAAGIYVHNLLNLPARCRVVELKQACYSATAAIKLALPMLQQNPSKKILVIASDIARYGLESTGESSQGSGAIALLLSTNPRLLAIEPACGFITKDVMDFWRPNYLEEALVDGKYSCEVYMRVMLETFKQYSAESKRNFSDHARFCYHTPVPRLVEKAHKLLAKHNNYSDLSQEGLNHLLGDSLLYNRNTGNCYTASLYVSLLSLLDNEPEDLSEKYIGLYSYGSGCVAEYFSGQVVPGYRAHLDKQWNQDLLANRKNLSYEEYQQFYTYQLPTDGSSCTLPQYNTGQFRLAKLDQHKRIYAAVDASSTDSANQSQTDQQPVSEASLVS